MNKKILLVEDDPAILLGLEDYLLAQSFDVIKADDGKVGYDLALKEKLILFYLILICLQWMVFRCAEC